MTLKQIIDTLAGMPAELPVYFSDGRHPTTFDSWRGDYSHLTLYMGDEYTPDQPEHWRDLPVLTVAELLEAARNAVGATFEGHKGGDFVMGEDTAVWADSVGRCTWDAIVGARVEADRVVFQILNIGEYR
jgi:hypothetical protein